LFFSSPGSSSKFAGFTRQGGSYHNRSAEKWISTKVKKSPSVPNELKKLIYLLDTRLPMGVPQEKSLQKYVSIGI